jgi:hypothetical protein
MVRPRKNAPPIGAGRAFRFSRSRSIEICVDKHFDRETVYFVAYFTEQPYGRAVCTSTFSPFIA